MKLLYLFGLIILVSCTEEHDEGCKKARIDYIKKRNDYIADIEQRSKFSQFYNFQFRFDKVPTCDEGGFFDHVQCGSKSCSCNYIDTGNIMAWSKGSSTTYLRFPKSAFHDLEGLLWRKCQIATQTKRTNVCVDPPAYYPCDPNAKKYVYNSITSRCEVSKDAGCYGFKTMESCAMKCHPKVYDKCSFKMDKGHSSCSKPQPSKSYHFNFITGECVPFTYRGCGGNYNNYKDIYTCEQSCVATTLMFEVDETERYSITLPVGVIKSEKYKSLNKISFAKFNEIRKKFPDKVEFYGYMEGAQTDRRVRVDSDGSVDRDRIQEEVDILRSQSTPEDICLRHKKKVDPCRAWMPRWYFDNDAKDCKIFMWGGCWPNGNNFKSYSECSNYCFNFVDSNTVSRGSKATNDGSSSIIFTTTG